MEAVVQVLSALSEHSGKETGIVKSLKLAMQAKGSELEYASPPAAARARGVVRALLASLPMFGAGASGRLGLAWAAGDLVALRFTVEDPVLSSAADGVALEVTLPRGLTIARSEAAPASTATGAGVRG